VCENVEGGIIAAQERDGKRKETFSISVKPGFFYFFSLRWGVFHKKFSRVLDVWSECDEKLLSFYEGGNESSCIGRGRK